VLAELAKCYLKKDEFDRALRLSKKLVKISPQEAQTYISLGLALAGKGLWDKAIENYGKRWRLEPENYPLRFKIGRDLHKKENDKFSRRTIQIYCRAFEGKRSGLALIALGDVYLKLKKYDEAIKYYKEIIKNQPKLAAAYANLCFGLCRTRKIAGRAGKFKEGVSLSPDEPVIRFNLGAAYEKRKMDAEAVKEYEQVLKN